MSWNIRPVCYWTIEIVEVLMYILIETHYVRVIVFGGLVYVCSQWFDPWTAFWSCLWVRFFVWLFGLFPRNGDRFATAVSHTNDSPRVPDFGENGSKEDNHFSSSSSSSSSSREDHPPERPIIELLLQQWWKNNMMVLLRDIALDDLNKAIGSKMDGSDYLEFCLIKASDPERGSLPIITGMKIVQPPPSLLHGSTSSLYYVDISVSCHTGMCLGMKARSKYSFMWMVHELEFQLDEISIDVGFRFQFDFSQPNCFSPCIYMSLIPEQCASAFSIIGSGKQGVKRNREGSNPWWFSSSSSDTHGQGGNSSYELVRKKSHLQNLLGKYIIKAIRDSPISWPKRIDLYIPPLIQKVTTTTTSESTSSSTASMRDSSPSSTKVDDDDEEWIDLCGSGDDAYVMDEDMQPNSLSHGTTTSPPHLSSSTLPQSTMMMMMMSKPRGPYIEDIKFFVFQFSSPPTQRPSSTSLSSFSSLPLNIPPTYLGYQIIQRDPFRESFHHVSASPPSNSTTVSSSSSKRNTQRPRMANFSTGISQGYYLCMGILYGNDKSKAISRIFVSKNPDTVLFGGDDAASTTINPPPLSMSTSHRTICDSHGRSCSVDMVCIPEEKWNLDPSMKTTGSAHYSYVPMHVPTSGPILMFSRNVSFAHLRDFRAVYQSDLDCIRRDSKKRATLKSHSLIDLSVLDFGYVGRALSGSFLAVC